MKYIGARSLSSAVSIGLQVFWWFALVASAAYLFVLIVQVFSIDLNNPVTSEIRSWDMGRFDNNFFLFYELDQIQTWPVAIRAVAVPFWLIYAVLFLIAIKSAQRLSSNFRKDLVFSGQNVRHISRIARVMILLAIISWNFGTLIVSILLLILCHIFQRGVALQEDHDLTI